MRIRIADKVPLYVWFPLLLLAVSGLGITFLRREIALALANTVGIQQTHAYKDQMTKAFKLSALVLPRAIPKVIHQSWKTVDLPDHFSKFSQSWKRKNPQHSYYLWTDEDNRELVRINYPQYLEFYDSLPQNIMRADLVRALYMHHMGGIYSDLDTWCLKPMDEITDNESILLAYMSMDYDFPHNIPNAWMASVPGHPFHIFFVETMISSYSPDVGPEMVTGPIALKRALEYWNAHSDPVKILRPGVVYVRDWHNLVPEAGPLFDRSCDAQTIDTPATEAKCKEMYPEAAVITFWTHSWGR